MGNRKNAQVSSSVARWEAFRIARQVAGLTQVEVAKRLGVHKMAVHAWEKAKYRPEPSHWTTLTSIMPLSLSDIAEWCAFFSSKRNSDL